MEERGRGFRPADLGLEDANCLIGDDSLGIACIRAVAGIPGAAFAPGAAGLEAGDTGGVLDAAAATGGPAVDGCYPRQSVRKVQGTKVSGKLLQISPVVSRCAGLVEVAREHFHCCIEGDWTVSFVYWSQNQ
jgi:hypothetical protein